MAGCSRTRRSAAPSFTRRACRPCTRRGSTRTRWSSPRRAATCWATSWSRRGGCCPAMRAAGACGGPSRSRFGVAR
eukprot:8366132-Lingulodinium_polyedra.AAC.1